MSGRRAFLRDARGGTAAEFALLLPLLLLFLFGIVDGGMFLWHVNKAEKATQMGVRYAVVTDMVPSNLIDYSFAPALGQGELIPAGSFGGVTCDNVGCTKKGAGPDPVHDPDAFAAIVARMQLIYPPITAADVTVDYDFSGLGYAGDPNGPDVSPLVTVKLRNLQFQPMLLLGLDITLPDFRAALTMEDGQGTQSN